MSIEDLPRYLEMVEGARSTGFPVELRSDGTVRVTCATQDIGTGTYTILAQIVSAKIRLPLDRISVVLGDTSLPPGPLSGGSIATASVIPAVSRASDQAISTLLYTATKAANPPFAGKTVNELALTKGPIHQKNSTPESSSACVLPSCLNFGETRPIRLCIKRSTNR
jgi:CO/xanthine dehydrogenase Mo-binding subunit